MTHISLPLGRPFIKAITKEILGLKRKTGMPFLISEDKNIRIYNQAIDDVVALIDPPVQKEIGSCPKGCTCSMGPH
jgi:hypothetical protein